ncbi:MAG TPA: hypothetical protein VG916_03475 [Gemmatimonadaceae bacterium]|nr:hypothetical protein [Gemmatimonadaceae bacterium]
MARRQVTGAQAPSALDELLSAERDIAAEATRVAGECAAIIAEARASATAIDREASAALEGELAGLREAAERDRARMAAETAARTTQTIAAFDGLTATALAELAEIVATRVMGVGGAPAPGAAS